MSSPALEFRDVALDDAGRMAEDLPCIGCGYNLRGLFPTGGCPECGRVVAHSTRVAKMGRCDPAYLRRVGGGVDWLIVTCAIIGLASLLGAAWANFEGGRAMIDRVVTILFCIIVLTGAIASFDGSRGVLSECGGCSVGVWYGLGRMLCGRARVEYWCPLGSRSPSE